jgi:hypothetical protein
VVDGSDFRSALSAQLLRGLLFLALKMGMYDNALAISIFILCTSLARADWQFTQWGMSEAELTSLSPHIVQTNAAERQGYSNPYTGTALYKSGYRAMEVDFTAYYTFNGNKLVAVTIRPIDLANWPKVNIAIGQVYGTPDEDKSYNMRGPNFCSVIDRKWRSQKEKNIVSVDGLHCEKGGERDFYSVKYAPILSSGGTGL